MKDTVDAHAEILAAATAYCHALHYGDADVLEGLCHPNYAMSSVQPGGHTMFFDKTAFVERTRAREPFPGEPSFEILSIDVEAPEMAMVKLWVDMPPRRFCDYLGFFHVDGEWKLISKLYRTASGPAVRA